MISPYPSGAKDRDTEHSFRHQGPLCDRMALPPLDSASRSVELEILSQYFFFGVIQILTPFNINIHSLECFYSSS